MGLREYRRKRDFRVTGEPAGHGGRNRGRRRAGVFVVQQHGARRLHYDFRLELEGVLKSWAVPKGPSMDPSERRLAVHVEDHPLEYGGFEGVIPEGQYGAGAVVLWDTGRWVVEGDPSSDYRRGRLKFRLEGEKLRGGWLLVRMSADEEGRDRDNWLLMKEKDAEARPGRGESLLKERPESVASGRELAQIAADRDRMWDSERGEVPGVRVGEYDVNDGAVSGWKNPEPEELPGARRASLPRDPKPQLATLVERAPTGDEWLHELKYDGYRLLCQLAGGKARLITRNGQDWTARLRVIADRIAAVPASSALLDGELVVMDSRGRTSFQALQNALGRRASERLRYVVFDLLHLNGYDLTAVPLEQRKAALASLLAGFERDDRSVDYSAHLIGNGPAVHEEACDLGAEGIISKRRNSRYRPQRTHEWVKIKCLHQQEFVIIGYTDPSGSRAGLGALLLGVYDNGRLLYCGKVGTGFTQQSLRELRSRLERLERKTPAAEGVPVAGGARGIHWTRPALVAAASFSDWTEDGRLRHPVFQGLREDVPPESVRRERTERSQGRGGDAGTRGTPGPSKRVARAGRAGGASRRVNRKPARRSAGRSKEAQVDVAGIRLSNPDRVLYPKMGITKLELAEFYETVSEWLLPHVADRLLTLVRCPEGHEGECFYQKHASRSFPPAVKRHRVREKEKSRTYISVDSLAGVIYLVQMGTLEFHVWGSRVDRPERPDRVVFDLDPDPDLPWRRVAEAAGKLRSRLGQLGLECFLKTTGGKGLHVVVPISRRHGWDDVKAFARAVAEDVVRHDPDRYTATVSKAKRRGKIYIDYLRNARGATAVTAYSTRALPDAPVSAPIAWDELDTGGGVRSDVFTVRNMPDRLAALESDPWEGIAGIRQSITRDIRRELRLTT